MKLEIKVKLIIKKHTFEWHPCGTRWHMMTYLPDVSDDTHKSYWMFFSFTERDKKKYFHRQFEIESRPSCADTSEWRISSSEGTENLKTDRYLGTQIPIKKLQTFYLPDKSCDRQVQTQKDTYWGECQPNKCDHPEFCRVKIACTVVWFIVKT